MDKREGMLAHLEASLHAYPPSIRTEIIKVARKQGEEVEKFIGEGEAGAGLVKVSINSEGKIISLKIDPTLLKDKESIDPELISDLAIAAHSMAYKKAEENTQAIITRGLKEVEKLVFNCMKQ